ncbi:MAG: adenosylcobinamide-phosphate synthase CbiB [Pseudomonadota bacterium]
MFSLAAALILDALLGEPKWLWSRLAHPAILMGRLITWGERHLNQGAARRLKGACLVAALLGLACGLGWVIAAIPLGWVWEVLFAGILLAQRSLADHVAAVAFGLGQNLEEGRRAVAMIVGRDIATMDGSAVARAAIESAGENVSDGVVAPAFWFAVAGLPGMMAYKIINTADSMIGYRTERYIEFGWAAARLDDVLNWVPARLTALLIALSHQDLSAWRLALAEAPLHRSPNAGWPEAALARVLGVAISGPRSYGGKIEDHPYVNGTGRRVLGAFDIERAVGSLWRVWIGLLAIVIIIGVGSLAWT